MARINYRLKLEGLSASDCFREATESELRVLLTLAELNGASTDTDTLVRLTGLSRARVGSAITLWQEGGFVEAHDGEPTLTEEFREDPLADSLDEEGSRAVARSIRNGELADVITECARLMGRPSLNTQEIKHITALWSQLALSGEYILTLAAHMAEGNRLTAVRLSREAVRLTDKGIDTPEALESYITNAEKSSAAISEFRRVVGIWNRNLSRTEREHFTRWSEEFGYSAAIVEEAFNAATASGTGRILAYMNKVLTAWHEAGCVTVEDCRRHGDEFRSRRDAMATAPKSKGGSGGDKPKSPKYAEFDPEEAMAIALARSFGDPGSGDESAE